VSATTVKKEEVMHRLVQKTKGAEYRLEPIEDHLELAAIGLESEFSVFLNGKPTKPEDIFKDPRDFVRGPLMHRVGTSYHMPNGGAIYFDTGVIEVATPVIEIERGCAARAGRSLWEAILFLRRELDDWERKTGNEIRLEGFSTHYNISFELPDHRAAKARGEKLVHDRKRTVWKLAKLLTYILPFPVALLAANKKSTGIGVRPRGNRIEITADFTPDASLMIAAATLITGVVREVMTWKSFELSELQSHPIPVIQNFTPMKHTSRKGWLAKDKCFEHSPFASNVDDPTWRVTIQEHSEGMMSLRQISKQIFRYFWRPIARLADPFTFRLLSRVMNGHTPALLDLPEQPAAYRDVGRLCRWDDLFPERALSRSKYERVLIHAISGEKLRIGHSWYRPTSMKGWSKVVFVPVNGEAAKPEADAPRLVSSKDGKSENGKFEVQKKHIFSVDYLVRHLDNWGRGRASS
jgi:hypothetical protein